jgi:SAM-dependent methyltransferase
MQNLIATPPKYYDRNYYLWSKSRFADFDNFLKKNILNRIYRQAIVYIPKGTQGPFLDVGCGRGEIALYLGRMGAKVYGIDYSEAAIKICRHNLNKEKKSIQKLVNFRKADCTSLPFPADTFGCIFLLDVVEHITPEQLNTSLAQVNRVLKTGGLLIIHTNNKFFDKLTRIFIIASLRGLRVFLKAKEILSDTEYMTDPYEHLHINYLSADQLNHYLNKAGFESKIDFVIPKNWQEMTNVISFREKWKKLIYYPIAWMLLNSPLKKFFAPTYWIVAKKLKKR